MNGRLGAVACAVMVLGMAAPAHALTAYVNYDSVVVSGGPGEKNDLTLQPDPSGASGSFVIVDTGIGVATHAGAGCEKTLRVIRCQLTTPEYVPSLSLSLGDRNDTAKVEGGFYYAQVDAGAGADTVNLKKAYAWGYGAWVTGGTGDDALDTRNGFYDIVDCGAGADTATADYSDSLTNC